MRGIDGQDLRNHRHTPGDYQDVAGGAGVRAARGLGLVCAACGSIILMGWIGCSLSSLGCLMRGIIRMLEKSDEGAIEYIRYGGM